MPEAPTAAPNGEDLLGIIKSQLAALGHRDDADVARLVAEIRRRHGERVVAVLLYGSYLRGKRDTLLDFYVLFDQWRGALPPRLQRLGNRLLPPNVYHLSLPASDSADALRAKYATLTLDQFEAVMDDFHCYFWARFTQPAGLVLARDEQVTERIAGAMTVAVHRFVAEAAPLVPAVSTFTAGDLWRRGLALTYGCELRSEDPAGVADLYAHNATHFDALLAASAAEQGALLATPTGRYAVRANAAAPPQNTSVGKASRRWRLRRIQGKLLSVMRLVKAALTFDDPLDYLLWKIRRHSGIYIEPSERQRRYPLIFAWGLLWRLYRRGAFR